MIDDMTRNGAVTMNHDDHKDARRDAQHALDFPTSPDDASLDAVFARHRREAEERTI